ncbi:TolB family protein [Luteipulveratus mongoliensis]|uniref:TolB n=1 Tax=Luteipulveratus mongoliensis TaxID=571913 RepID=A0A0K1JH30_9MICO|nr:hypothetical protein [Luteipulveratus mongoliensis]AKU15893.1 TolB [Luteipulveratus mongoliensis]
MTKNRIVLALIATLLLATGAVAYVIVAARRTAGAAPAGVVALDHTRGLLIRSTADGPGYGRLAVMSTSGSRTTTSLTCARVYYSGTNGVCLRPSKEAPGTFEVAVLDEHAGVRRTLPLNGVPSRARTSPSGKMVAWTVFVAGDSYNGGRFSTRSGILNTATKDVVATLETFHVTLDGKPYKKADINYWGITFTKDDNRFYATMSTAGKRYLVAGDIATKSVRTLHDNVECPSLSSDGTRLAYKKRVSSDPAHMWRLTVLDLATMTETPLAETRNVDDQAAWRDDRTVVYGVPRDARHSDVWAVPADGSGKPTIAVRDAESPASLR